MKTNYHLQPVIIIIARYCLSGDCRVTAAGVNVITVMDGTRECNCFRLDEHGWGKAIVEEVRR